MTPQDEILSLDWRVEYIVIGASFGSTYRINEHEFYDCSLSMKEVIRDFGRDFPHATIKSVQRVQSV